MTDPIRPEDHRVYNQTPEVLCEYDRGQPTTLWPERIGLTEAIHQAFERDARKDAERRDFPVAEPDSEIDRLARLIVQGEYRRRRAGEAAKVAVEAPVPWTVATWYAGEIAYCLDGPVGKLHIGRDPIRDRAKVQAIADRLNGVDRGES